MDDYGNIPVEEPFADTAVFIPELSKALAPFITEAARSEGYEWEWQRNDWVCVNACPYHIKSIFDQFDNIVHKAISIFASEATGFTAQGARNNLESFCASTETAPVLADALKDVNVEEVWNIVQRNSQAIGIPDLPLQSRY